MDWDPQPMFTAEQAAAGVFFFVEIIGVVVLFWKNMFRGPQALFTTEQAAAGIFLSKNDMPFWKRSVLVAIC